MFRFENPLGLHAGIRITLKKDDPIPRHQIFFEGLPILNKDILKLIAFRIKRKTTNFGSTGIQAPTNLVDIVVRRYD